MSDRMDQLVTAAEHQGFTVRQTTEGAWMFGRGQVTVTYSQTPSTAPEWMYLIRTLRGAGLVFPTK